MWYGQCTRGDKPKNCLYNGPAKSLTDPKGVKLLNSICPELKGQPTCCSTNQLVALGKNLQTMAQLTTRCPACWNNMRRLYCQLTCNQDQSLYLDPKTIRNDTGHETIIDVNYFVSPTFKKGLFDSCKDVSFPDICLAGEKVLNLLCGTTVEKCTPQKLLEYMGNTANGFAPFDIHYPRSLAPHIKWMSVTIFKCNVSFIDPQTNKTAGPCSCQDCVASCPHRPPLPPQFPAPHGMKLDDSKFRKEQLIIKSTHPTSTGYHRFGDEKWIPFGPIFHLELLNQVIGG